MAQLYSTGPAHIFVTGTAGVTLYLGTCEKAPRIPIRPGWKPVFNDLGGSVIPFDMSYQGEEAFTFGDFNRYNEPVLAVLQARPLYGGARGLNGPGDIGTLAGTEGGFFQMTMYFPYSAKLAMASGGMPGGYRFPFTILEGPDDLNGLGTNPKQVSLIFHHLRQFSPSTGQFLLYDHNVGTMPPID